MLASRAGRAERLARLQHLLQQGPVSNAELSRRLGASPRTISRDVAALKGPPWHLPIALAGKQYVLNGPRPAYLAALAGRLRDLGSPVAVTPGPLGQGTMLLVVGDAWGVQVLAVRPEALGARKLRHPFGDATLRRAAEEVLAEAVERGA